MGTRRKIKQHISKLSIEEADGKRTFHHHMLMSDGRLRDCKTCYVECDSVEPLYTLWAMKKAEERDLNKAIMTYRFVDLVERENLESLMFCDESGTAETNKFLKEIFQVLIPEQVRFCFCRAIKLKINFEIYVKIVDCYKVFKSSPIRIQHQFDVAQTVEVIGRMLILRIKYFMKQTYQKSVKECEIRWVKMNFDRTKLEYDDLPPPLVTLPLKYRLRNDDVMCPDTLTSFEMAEITLMYLAQTMKRIKYLPPSFRANLYRLQYCQESKRSFVVPYYLQTAQHTNFLIMEDACGFFMQLRQIKDLDRLLRRNGIDEDYGLACSDCLQKFDDQTELGLHIRVKCGREFKIEHPDPMTVEYYDESFLINRNDAKYACYAVHKPKTVHKWQVSKLPPPIGFRLQIL